MTLQTRGEDHARMAPVSENRRQDARVRGSCAITFSGVNAGRFVIGDGQMLNLSARGVGIRGNQRLKPGMELALFIELPDGEEHVCVPEARVSWVNGRRFGVALRTVKPEDRDRLKSLLGKRHGDKG